MYDEASINNFKTGLFSTLLWGANTNEIDRVVDTFIEKISVYFGFDAAEIYFPTAEILILRGIYGIDRYYVCKVYYPLESEKFKNYIEDKQIYIGDNINYTDHKVFSDYKTIFIMPIFSYPKPIGVIILRSKENKKEYFQTLIPIMTSLLEHFSIYANNVIYRTLYTYRENQLNLLRDIDTVFTYPEQFENILDTLTTSVAKIFSAKKCLIRLKNEKNEWSTRSVYGDFSGYDLSFFENYEYFKECHQKKVYRINLIDNKKFPELIPIINRSILFSPLMQENKTMGYIVVIDRIADAANPLGDFTSSDSDLFVSLAKNITSKIYETRTMQLLSAANAKNSLHTARLNILYDIGNILLEKSKEDDILFLLLTVTTIGDAFAFNRAFAFLYDSQFNVFRGKMCVAPKDGQDAFNIWENMKQRDNYGFREKILLALGENALKYSYELNKEFINTVIPNNENCYLFNQAYLTKQAINVTTIEDNLAVSQLRKYTNTFGLYPFAIIPIISASECIGIIVVDNTFNYKPITDDDLDYLRMFGRQAAVALEYSAMYNEIEKSNRNLKEVKKNLLEAQHLALVGEMSSSIAHNLRNYIVPIAGFANRLSIARDNPDKLKEYAQIISVEVSKLEIYIKRNLSFSKTINLEIEEINIDSLLNSLKTLAIEHIEKSGKKIVLFTASNTKEESVHWDYSRMHEGLLDLIVNGIDAIDDDNLAFISIIVVNNKRYDNMIDIVVENTNSLIPPDILPKIFTPFFTTKSHGTGIGLATCKRVIEAHGGSIAVESKEGKFSATTFFITMPKYVE